MNETSKMYNIRKSRGDFDKFLHGHGLDVGAGGDPLRIERGRVVSIDSDGENLAQFNDEQFDFLYSSHCIEHLEDIEKALKNWSRVVKPGGHIYIVAPDWEIYEKKCWPSRFNGDHKHTFSLRCRRNDVGRQNHWHIEENLKPILIKNGLEPVSATFEDFGYDYTRPDEDQTFTTNHAVCQICIIARKIKSHSVNSVKMPENRYYVEFGGGLGDIINQMFRTPNYIFFETIKQKTTALLITHNPFATEIFENHPNKNLIDIILKPWIHPKDVDKEIRKPLKNEGYTRITPYLPTKRQLIKIYPHESEFPIINSLSDKPYTVIQPFAGTRERDLPPDIMEKIIKHMIDRTNLNIAIIGRTYKREGADHSDENNIHIPETKNSRIINLIDKLTVPGTMELIRQSAGFIGTHSSMNITAWHYRKPCVILYDKETQKRHFLRTDEWSFGKDHPNTTHTPFEEFKTDMLKF